MQKSKIYFIFLSLSIALICSIFIINHYNYTEISFHKNLDNKQQNYYAIYNALLSDTYEKLSLQTQFFADDIALQDLFLYGKKMLTIEGSPNGAEETNKIRQRLYQHVIKDWQKIVHSSAANSFQFHLGPGSLSFLRVHKPKKFGDNLDNLRFSVVDTNKEQTPRTGFETGRITSALRSIKPIFAWDMQYGKKVYVGALEIGIPFNKLLTTMQQQIGIGSSILLNNHHIKQTVWDEFISVNYKKKSIKGCNCIIESSSSPEQKQLLEYFFKNSLSKQLSTQILKNSSADIPITRIEQYDDKYYAFQFYPLRDYLGEKNLQRPDVGSVFISKDITLEIQDYQKEQFNNIFYAVIAYGLIELFLIFTFIKVTKHLTSQVKEQSLKLADQGRKIDLDGVKYKNLIDTINNNYFFYSRNNTRLLHVSSSIKQVLGYSDTEFLSNSQQYLTENSKKILFKIKEEQTFLEHKKNTYEVDVINKSGRLQYLLITETSKYNLNKTQTLVVEGLAQDISQSRQEKMLLQLSCKILQMITDKKEQTKILEALVLGIESIIQDITCSIMLVDMDSSTLIVGAAPNVEESIIKVLDGQSINSAIGSCGMAVKNSKREIIYDIKQNKALNKLVDNTAYQSFWSEPILSNKAKVLATLDVYYKTRQKPNETDFAIIAIGINLLSSLLNKDG